jgi:hypothetical protein
MPRALKNIRPLYLLALFQLVGGPAVLLVVLLFGRLSVSQVSEHGLAQGIAVTLQSDAWQTAAQEVLQTGAALPATERDKVPVKPQETKAKLYAAGMESPVTAPAAAATDIVPRARDDVSGSARAQAPPAPPPRLA